LFVCLAPFGSVGHTFPFSGSPIQLDLCQKKGLQQVQAFLGD
jgi:hypothetical protein